MTKFLKSATKETKEVGLRDKLKLYFTNDKILGVVKNPTGAKRSVIERTYFYADGKIKFKERYDKDGNIIYTQHYHANGCIDSATYYDTNGAVTSTKRYVNGNLVEHILYNQDESIRQKITYKYDAEKARGVLKIFDGEDNLKEEREYTLESILPNYKYLSRSEKHYYQDGRLESEKRYDSKGYPTFIKTCDQDGKVLESVGCVDMDTSSK